MCVHVRVPAGDDSEERGEEVAGKGRVQEREGEGEREGEEEKSK